MPTYITTTQFLAIADNIAKTLVDSETDFIVNPGANSPTVTTINAGLTGASNSLAARVAALAPPVGALAPVNVAKATSAMSTFLSVPFSALYANYAPFILALDQDLGDTADFVLVNGLQVHPEFANCFNYVAVNAQRLFGANYTPTPILPVLVFPLINNVLGTINVTGAAAGTFVAGTALNSALYGSSQLFIKNATVIPGGGAAPTLTAATATVANPSALAAGTYTVGYTWLSAAGESTLSATATQAVTVGQYINVASISFPTGATGIKFYVSVAAGNTSVGYSDVNLTAAAAVAIGDVGNAALPAPSVNGALIPSVGTATSLTLTYTNANGLAGQSVVQALSGALAAGATLAVGTTLGQAVSNIVVGSGGVNADSFQIVVQPLRTVTY